jgi:hypothetical protein
MNADKTPPERPADVTAVRDEPATALPAKTDVCQQAPACKTFDEYAERLRACPSTPDRQELLAALARLIEKQKGSDDEYKKFAQEFEDGVPFIPPVHRLALVGPEGLRVHDCLEYLKNGMETTEVLAKIRAQNTRYKDFTLEEIEMLKEMGLTSSIIQAMIESTITAEREEKPKRERAQGGIPVGSQGVQDGPYAGSSGEQQQIEIPVAGGGTGPSLQDAVVNCAAQTAALEVCKQLSGLARSICNAAAKAQFPCQ